MSHESVNHDSIDVKQYELSLLWAQHCNEHLSTNPRAYRKFVGLKNVKKYLEFNIRINSNPDLEETQYVYETLYCVP